MAHISKMAAVDKTGGDTIDSHISFLYNNISSSRSDQTFEYRDDAEAPDSLADHSQTSPRHRPLKKMRKRFKKLVKKVKATHRREDNEPLMKDSCGESTLWVRTLKSGSNVTRDYSDSQIL